MSQQRVEYFTWDSLNRANNRAIRMNLNRMIDKEYINSLNKELIYPVNLSLFKEGYKEGSDVMRYILITDIDGTTVHIDVPLKFKKKDVFSMELLGDGKG